MPRRSTVLACVCLLWIVSATPAYAWFGDGWVEKLSGPGPFKGFTADVRVLCLAIPEARIAKPQGFGERLRMEVNDRMSISPAGCHYLQRDAPRVEIGFQYSRFWTDTEGNLLDYGHRPEVASLDRGVTMGLWMATADIRVNSMVDVGTAFGRARFGSPDQVFDDFGKWEFDPVRVSLRPMAPLSTQAWTEILNLRFEGKWFIGGFDDEDFGARPDTFNEPGEIVWGWSIVADFGPLLWQR